ncbi:MAG: hydroxyacylglutathione hydrolase [Phreatobacter sp.]|uniref:hydroxyacylglutathione hydrolase n=1 Tax=Phreatobacter sp. TaxID=1966341 RepID=UPI002737503D|nr:hydroxyacylglutathione hydrolase [Phreatobacter sp.]MDP2803426.1 hydroxyacylglutathione hydrolase [Phreatobacter sp.]
MAADVHLFTCLSDNFGALIHDPATGATAAIDVPEAEPVLAAAKAKGWTISHILVTHHHPDHVQGIEAVKAATGAHVIANAADAHRIPLVDETVAPGGKARFGSLEADVIDTPGHTVGHIAYHFAAEKILFSGDTLFSLGCGRLFEGTPQQMWEALKVLRALPDDTAVYCGHEYTGSNATFAVTVDPDNQALKIRAAEVASLRAAGRPTLPTTLGQEKATNPFLRADDAAIAAVLGMKGALPAEVFAELRERKNKA